MVTGTDLVEWQIKVARGEELPLSQEQIEEKILSGAGGHTIEARIYAEIPEKGLPRLDIPGVRVDAGFVEGDLVSAHYDPMIAKLITHGATRTEALAKMVRALEQYEIAGLGVNIEFLKNVVGHAAFVEGDVETGFIEKHRQDLFGELELPDEVAMQAALACCLNASNSDANPEYRRIWSSGGNVGFTSPSTYSSYSFSFMVGDHEEDGGKTGKTVSVEVQKTDDGQYTVILDGGRRVFERVAPVMRRETRVAANTLFLETFTTRARLDSTVIILETGALDSIQTPITVFHQGRRYAIHTLPSPWLQKLLAQNSVNTPQSSVRAPMPCKILRVEVEPGQIVEEGKPLVVVESMKMETVIRAPGPGPKLVKRVVHKAGDMCKAGTALVEFDEDDGN
ncbi:Biotin carboxylase [Ascosphaera apis ARSEF 7405]|uniref:Biotin carboxylase n=1 Tax=Ascosphaera apis ARSEF 7405 TaxID=392613 RepID=A0A168DV69_9EURO|nr:Biotin carboxylase [Ascosphaera apis ARSEF 7405]